jgi:hypothetical protein
MGVTTVVIRPAISTRKGYPFGKVRTRTDEHGAAELEACQRWRERLWSKPERQAEGCKNKPE